MAMLQISRRADYAVRMMMELGLQPDARRLSARVVSRRTGVPKAFLHKISSDLVRAGLITTSPGSTGGLALARPAAEINLRQVLEAVEGAVCLNVCLLRPHECPRDQSCAAHGFWGRLQTAILAELEGATLAKLVQETSHLRQHPARWRDVPYLFPE